MGLAQWPATRCSGSDGAAAIADPTARRALLSKISPEKHASAFLGLGVIGDDPKPALARVTKSLELRHEIASASLEDLKRHHDNDVALLIPLDKAGLLKIRQQRLAYP